MLTIRLFHVALAAAAAMGPAGVPAPQAGAAGTLQFVFTSDAHYGITRPAFRGTNVDARVVNAVLVQRPLSPSAPLAWGRSTTVEPRGSERRAEPAGRPQRLVHDHDWRLAARDPLTTLSARG